MNLILETVKDFLENENTPFQQVDDRPILKTGFMGNNGNFTTVITADDKDQFLEAFTVCPIKVAKSKLAHAIELIVRINWKLRLGNFDIDLTDGEIGFRTGMKVGKTGPDDETIGGLIGRSMFTMDFFFPAIASVVYGNVSPAKAIAALNGHHSNSEGDEKSSADNMQPRERDSRNFGTFPGRYGLN